MKPGRRSVVAPPSTVPTRVSFYLSQLPWLVACVMMALVAFCPDEKLVRLKLLGLESCILLLVALVGAKLLLDAQTENRGALLTVAVPPLLFLLIQSLLWWTTPETSLASVEMRRVILTAASFLVFAASGFSLAWRNRFLWSWSWCAALISIYGMLERVGGVGMLLVPQMDRPAATFGNPIFFAAYLLISLFVAVQATTNATRLRTRVVGSVLAILIWTALICTQTRSAWIGLVIASIVGVTMALPQRKGKMILLLAVLVGTAILAWGARSTLLRDQAHLLIWRDTVTMWKTHPWTGVGLGTFHIHFPDFAGADLKAKWPAGTFIVNDAHNEFLQQLAEGGMVGLVSWLLIPLLFVVVLIARPAVRNQWAWLSAGIIGLGVQNLFSVDMRFGISASLAAMAMGMVVGVGFAEREQGPRRSPLAIVFSIFWLLLIMVGVGPRLLRPYTAQTKVSATPNFFDQRLLEPAKTISDLEALSEKYPNEPAVLERLGFVYAKEMQSPDKKINQEMAGKAIDVYQKILMADPTRVGVYNNLANVHYTLGHVDTAIQIWRSGIAQDPHAIDARLNLGKILFSQGRIKEAAAQFEAVLKDDPGNASATLYLKKMVE